MQSRDARVTVVVVTFNARATIDAALAPLAKAGRDGALRCVVVDNASADGTAEHVASRHPWVDLRPAGGNIGFGRGCNIGIRAAQTDYVLLLNPDAVLPVEAIDRLVAFMDEHPRAGICGPAVREPSGVLQSAGALPTPWRIMLTPLFPRWAARGRRIPEPGEAPARTDWICGSIFLLRRDLTDEIGAFDPRFFLYFEETDLCHRALRAGWEIWTVGEAVGTHVNAAATKDTGDSMLGDTISEHYFQSRFYYMRKRATWLIASVAELGEIALMALRACVQVLRGRGCGHLKSRLSAPILQMPRRVPVADGEK